VFLAHLHKTRNFVNINSTAYLDTAKETCQCPLGSPSEDRPLGVQKSEVLQGTLDLMVLKTLDVMSPLHGYGVARRIERLSEDMLELNEGTVCASLRLTKKGVGFAAATNANFLRPVFRVLRVTEIVWHLLLQSIPNNGFVSGSKTRPR
jgi:hypothetical protein